MKNCNALQSTAQRTLYQAFLCTFSRRFKVTVPQKAEFWEVLPEFLPVLAEFLKILFTEGPTEDSKT